MTDKKAQDKASFQGRGVFKKPVPIQTEKAPRKHFFQKRGVKTVPFFAFLVTITGISLLAQKKPFRSKKGKVMLGFGMLLFIIGALIVMRYNALQQDPAVLYAKKMTTMTDQVRKYTTLPTGEDPVIATVTDIKVLPHEVFFANAQNGDKILMYKKHKKAILYRPSTGRVITTAILDFEETTPTPVPQGQTVAGASTSAEVTITPGPTALYHPQGKILVMPQ